MRVSDRDMGDEMIALNRAFEKAFASNDDNDSVVELLACMGEELGCDRISIFEENTEGLCDNTYEWCAPGVIREQILLQNLEVESFDSWHDRLINREIIVIRSLDEVKDSDVHIYRMFLDQDIHCAIVSLLAFHGRTFGFCIFENPSEMVLEDTKLIMPGTRYILSSLLYSRNLVSRLRKIGYTDVLTGAGNRVSLKEHIALLHPEHALGVLAVDVVGWNEQEGKLLPLEREQTLLHAGEVLVNLFDEEHVFRVATGEFVILVDNQDEKSFNTALNMVRIMFHEQNLLAVIVGEWKSAVPEKTDDLIQEVRQIAEKERNLLLSHRKQMHKQDLLEHEGEERAEIHMPKGDAFLRLADHFLSGLCEENVIAVVTDINYFKLYNDIFGRKAGNVFLETIASVLGKEAQAHQGICGYFGGDNFCLLISTKEQEIQNLSSYIESVYQQLDYPDGFSPAMGVYLSTDRRETVITMYDRAMNALSAIKGDYMRHIHYYSAQSHQHQKEDKILLMKVKEGLDKGEFVFYIQPQVHDRSGKIIGGEALVRWMHEGKLISPGKFIPILEKTGYVYAVDSYIWESVASWQKELIDKGIRPVPLSVNVSRVDFYFDDIAKHFIELVEKYDLDPSLLGIEITESAFTDNTDTIIEAIHRLHEVGFHILMDDFGSGSSSLSMLHSMNLDVLKTDVQFMSKGNQDNKAISIVESVISMAHMIGMSVVTEGVETEEQKNNLIALGDNFAQGFYFYRPMPAHEFLRLIQSPENVTTGYKRKKDSQNNSQLCFRQMIREGLVSETLLHNILRASAIYREENGKISIVQINEQFTVATGITQTDVQEGKLEERMDIPALKRLMTKANDHALKGCEGDIRFRKKGSYVTLPMRLFLIYSCDNHRLYLSTMN